MAKSNTVSQHFLVPDHQILSKAEVEELKKKFGNLDEFVPWILSTDAMVEEIEAKKGDIIRIARKSQTAGESIYYRRVL